METSDICHTSLALGLGFPSAADESTRKTELHKPINGTTEAKTGIMMEPNLTLALSGESYVAGAHRKATAARNKVVTAFDHYSANHAEFYGRQASPHSTVSSFSSPKVKRERDLSSEEVEAERGSSRASEEDDVIARKKLRLTKDQSAFLEKSFKQHSTLNPNQKQALARQLNLRPRQVEVWFQNRRARTKLKQTEVDCELLKECCEMLTDENRRLQRELQELKALKLAQPFHMHMQAATITMCPSCERVSGTVCDGGSKRPFSMAPKANFYNPFNNPSAAC